MRDSLEGKIKLNPEFYSLTIVVEETLEYDEEDEASITVSAEIEVELCESFEH